MECAADQGYFWAYHGLLMANQPRFASAELKKYAEQVGLDTKVFNKCLDSGKHRGLVNAQTQEAVKLKLPGTPTFLLNGQEFELKQSYMEIVDAAKALVSR